MDAMQAAPFLSVGGWPQDRYERLRAYMLEDPARRPRVSPAQFDLRRFNRYGLLGLTDQGLRRYGGGEFEVEIVPIDTEDASDRLARLCELLAKMATKSHGGGHATSGAVRQSFDRPAGEGADDSQPARCGDALR